MGQNICEMLEEKIDELLRVRALLVEVDEAFRPLRGRSERLLALPAITTLGADRKLKGGLENMQSPLGGTVPAGPVVVAPRPTKVPAGIVTEPSEALTSQRASLDDLVREVNARTPVREPFLVDAMSEIKQ